MTTNHSFSASVFPDDWGIIEDVGETTTIFGESFQNNDIVTGITDLSGDESYSTYELDSTEKAIYKFSQVMIIGVCVVLSILGVISNIINIVIFTKQGFQDSVNIGLCSIAVSDFVIAITILFAGICQNPLFQEADLQIMPFAVELFFSSIPRDIGILTTAMLTVLVTLERCLCVTFPLKIKEIMSRKRTKFIVSAIFIFVIATQCPAYYLIQLGWYFVPERNKTILDFNFILPMSHPVNAIMPNTNISITVLTFLSVLVCSIILIVQLTLRSKWRQSIAASGKSVQDSGKEAGLTSRDWRVIKMVATVAVMFITCFTPYVVVNLILISEPKYYTNDKYRIIFTIYESIQSLLEAINSSSNILIYYHMSSKYKSVFRANFCRCADKKHRPE